MDKNEVNPMVAHFVEGLKSRSEEVREKSVKDLKKYVSKELPEMNTEDSSSFVDDFSKCIFDMISSSDLNERKGGICAIIILVPASVPNKLRVTSRFGNYLKNQSPTDLELMELTAHATGKVARELTAESAYVDSYVEFEVTRSLEHLNSDKNDNKKHSALLTLKELAHMTPVSFNKQADHFFDQIFAAVRHNNIVIREAAIAALRVALSNTAVKELKDTNPHDYYSKCLEESLKGFDEASNSKDKTYHREERIHGSLMVINELLRISSVHGERTRQEVEESEVFHTPTSSSFSSALSSSSTSRFQALKSLVRGANPIRGTSNTSSYVHIHPGHGLKGLKELVDYHRDLGLAPGLGSSKYTKREKPVHSQLCSKLVQQQFKEICDVVLSSRNKDSRAPFVQQTTMLIFPRIASFDPKFFSRSYLNDTMAYLFRKCQEEKSRCHAFVSIGLIATAVRDDMKPFIAKIFELIKSALPTPRDVSAAGLRSGTMKSTATKGTLAVEPAIFTCLRLLAEAVSSMIHDEVKSILETMLATGLSPSLTSALRSISFYIPQLKGKIQEGLLKILEKVLIQSEDVDVKSTVLALEVLGRFDFSGRSLMKFLRCTSESYISSQRKEIKLEAVKTCSSLLSQALTRLQGQYSLTLNKTIQDVLSKLLEVAVTDTDAPVRYSVLARMDDIRFDPHLAQKDNLNALFICLNDELFEIRELALCIIGRLSSINPACVMPPLRVKLLQLITDIEFSGVARNKEKSSRMLAHLISNAPLLIRPYTEPIIRVFIGRLKEPEQAPSVLTSVLAAIGAQAQVSGPELKKWVDELFPPILENIQDASSQTKREVGLWALGELVCSTGYVVEPFKKYPNLMEVLFSFLRTEHSNPVKKEVIRDLGFLGAMDPYKHKINLGVIDQSGDSLIAVSETGAENQDMGASELLVSLGGTHDDFYIAIAIATLMKVMRDSALSQHHMNAVQALLFIFVCYKERCVTFIPQVLPAYLAVIRSAESSHKEYLFQTLADIIKIVKNHIRNFLDDIFDLIKEHWAVKSSDAVQGTLIELIEQIVSALGAEFKLHVPQLIPHILRVLDHDTSKRRVVTGKLLSALRMFESNLDDYLHIILPRIIKLFDSDIDLRIREEALNTIDVLSLTLDITEYASCIIHPLVRVLDKQPELRESAMNALVALVSQMGRRYQVFIPMVHRVMKEHRIHHQGYEVLIGKILKGETISESEGGADYVVAKRKKPAKSKALEGSAAALVSGRKDVTDFKSSFQVPFLPEAQPGVQLQDEVCRDWFKNLSIKILLESPSLALRSCYPLAQSHPQITKDLFNAAFLATWSEMTEDQQQKMISNLETVLSMPNVPEITQSFLNLAEFMEHCEKGPLHISYKVLSERATRCRAFAKALHYKEEEFHAGPTTEVLEALISINTKLQQSEAAFGVLEYAKRSSGGNFKIKERWYEKLHEWEDALRGYNQKREINPNDTEAMIGEMRCLENLGDWHKLYHTADEAWSKITAQDQEKMARSAACSAWSLNEWPAMENYVSQIRHNSADSAFYKAVIEVHHKRYDYAQILIDQGRKNIESELAAMVGESYNRAYVALVQVMMLSELEEVIQYDLIPERRELIKEKWWKRLQGCQRTVEDWQKILQVHSLVLSPEEDMRTWLKFASLCQESRRTNASSRILCMLMGKDPSKTPEDPLPMNYPQVTFAYIKHQWKSNNKQVAFKYLQDFISVASINQNNNHHRHHSGLSHLHHHHPHHVAFMEETQKKIEMDILLSRCYLKLGQWTENLRGINEESIPAILKCYDIATKRDTKWYKAWHSWAYMNYEAVLFYKQQLDQHKQSGDPSPQIKNQETVNREFTVPAVEGFFNSITLSHGNSLQDTLRLLTLWFDHGQYHEVYECLFGGIKKVPIETWLQVIPQLIARIDTPRHFVGRLIHQLLIEIGKYHPQALIYPLTVAAKSAVPGRQHAANKILQSMTEHSPKLVQDAKLVSRELIRVAILWHELWHEGLEEASRLYFGEKKIDGMFATLEPLHAMMKEGPQTLKETSFDQYFGKDLEEAYEWCKKYKQSHNVKDLTQAWDLYYHVFRRISKQLPQLTSLELEYVSPRLLECRDLELAVPGSYIPNQEINRIAKVGGSLAVITSKQRPRKLSIRGSNGKDFMFLLKGHEDLRQDERVMQLFGLVNTLLVNDSETSRRNLAIQRYAVIPLSTNSGLIGWVPHCDTLHTLIRDYRDKKKILLNIEHRIMLRMAPDYDHLSLMQKVEVFEHALEHTQGDDLSKLLWLKSPSSEVWFDRRTNYTRSLAVMSMVGYVLGLGDRHPSNLMLDRLSGKILHIDFGDCFEVAMTREKFPEKIPFRLTRMLINAMEVTGIEGTYRMTCQKVMKVLRNNKDSLMAVLEAFVYDPLLNWRLVDCESFLVYDVEN